MAANTQPIFALTVINPIVQILPADTTTFKTLRVGSTNGDRIDNIMVTSTDTVARVLSFAINDGSTDHVIGEVNIPATSGTDGAAAVKQVAILTLANFPGLNTSGSLFLQATYSLKVRAETTVTAAKVIEVVSFGGAY